MTYQDLINRILQLQEDGLELFNAGKSVLGKNILATHIGSYSGPQVLIQGGIHAREYITSLLLVEMARDLFFNNKLTDGGIYFIFLTNPDGAQLVLDGIESVKCDITRNYLTSANGNSTDFKQYKANINLVDLNTNFKALWGQGEQNVFCPAIANFVGYYPESEREVQSLVSFTLNTKPTITISYHTKGEVVYWGFENESEANLERDKTIGEAISTTTGYQLLQTKNSTGGYKDWCIDSLKIPAYTIEVGNEELPHPITEEYLPEIYEKNKLVPIIALEKAKEFASLIDFTTPLLQNISRRNNNELYETGNIARIQGKFLRRSANRCHNC